MKKILILCTREKAFDFLKKLELYAHESKEYIIISDDEFSDFKGLKSFRFDPCNAARLDEFLDSFVECVYVILGNEKDTRLAYDAVRKKLKRTNLIILSNNAEYENDLFCSLINPSKMISDRLVDMLPNMPFIARDIGHGSGEIMQVRVPSGSIYANKHIGAIAQDRYKIALIYRGNQMILPAKNVQIEAEDELILVGEPKVLSLIFSRIKGQMGQFPGPYGEKICLFIDMVNDKNVKNLINTALLLHAKSNSKKLDILIINPTINDDLALLSSLRKKSINIKFHYKTSSVKVILSRWLRKNSGLLIASKFIFFANITHFYESKMPVLKVGSNSFASLNAIASVASSSLGVENLTSILLDFSTLFKLPAKLLYFDASHKISPSLQEHVNTQSAFFNKELKLINFRSQNPLIYLRHNLSTLQCLGFEEKMLKRAFFSFLSTDFAKFHRLLDKNYQLFIPVE